MGSVESRESQIKGQIFISLESNNTNPGGIFRGSIHVSLLEQINNPALYLVFKGNEITDFKIQHNGKTTYYSQHKGKNLLCALKATLYEWPDKIALPGNFSFPFELQTYNNLLPSFYTSALWGGFCQISYSIRAQLRADDRQPLKFKEPVFIITDIISLPPEMYPNSLEKDCSGSGGLICCFSNEDAVTKITIEKGILGFSDSIEINLETNLTTFSAYISRVKIEIKKIITMTANKKNPQVATQTISMLKLNEKPKIMARSGTQHFNYKIPIREILKNENSCTWNTPLIKCHFVMNIKLHTKTFSWRCYVFNEASQGIVILPFEIQIPASSPPIAPEHWQAQLLPQSYIKPGNQGLGNPDHSIVESFALASHTKSLDKDNQNYI
ncbi:unnamed protein product [Blepharisma stoltei]|uniref:Arrestin-like N-terminal domain-containing protein n=1 Tax=Blepharisma stoltei TaxID=1481888 RepID=A0AAU9IS72_9CILI|nr:unnamed protein product [Blepharisma stoltei]